MTTSAREVKELKAELRHLASKVEKTVSAANANANGLQHNIAEVLSITPDEMRRAAKKAGKNLRTYFGRKADEATDLYHQAETKVTEKPMQSIALALAAGFVLSSLLRRR